MNRRLLKISAAAAGALVRFKLVAVDGDSESNDSNGG
jgi:hypothetical protein